MPNLPLRQKQVFTYSNDSNSRKPFGIPIYEYLKSIKDAESLKRKQPDSILHSQPKEICKKRKKHSVPSALLCEKYRPSDFFDLCGNDDANRQVLRWMNYWKSIVFGSDPILSDYTDRLGRPMRKILLLNGPPGTGKTTAAHVIARQAGFDVLEINASDDRGAVVVQDRIVSAIQSHQVHRKRPICIVADEVEGASEHGFVRALVNILNEDAIALSKNNQKRNSLKNNNRKKKKKYSLLLRPIIAVCNNAWASNLHSLRPLAEIINFHRQPISRLVKQLEKICICEKFKLDQRELVKIVESNNFDLRSCLNALQFGALNGGDMNSNLLESVEMTSWNSLLRQLFGATNSISFKQIECCSDIDKLVLGCFTAYPEMGFNEDLIKSPAQLGDYLALADNRAANDELKALTVHACGQLFRSPALAAMRQGSVGGNHSWSFGRPYNTFDTMKQTKGIVQSVLKRAVSSVRTRITEKIAMMDVLPLTITIASPRLGTIITPEDKVRLSLIAELFTDLGINLRTERLENGTFAHFLDPPVHQACVIGEKMRDEAAYGSYVARTKVKEALKDLRARETRESMHSQSQIKSKHWRDDEDISSKPPVRNAVDFSQFFQSGTHTSATQVEKTAAAKATRVWVQYSEGFSNAVRKNVAWDDLFKA